MPLVIPPGFAQLTVPMKHASLVRSAVVTFGVATNGAFTPTELCDRAAADFQAALQTTIDSQVTVGPVEASVGQDGGENLAAVGSHTFVGTRASDSQPPNCALIARKLTNRGGRRGRGRMFLPWCIAETAVDEVGVITPANVTTINGLLDDLLDNLLTAPAIQMVLLHSTGNTPTGAPDAVQSLQLDTRIGNQRDRLGR